MFIIENDKWDYNWKKDNAEKWYTWIRMFTDILYLIFWYIYNDDESGNYCNLENRIDSCEECNTFFVERWHEIAVMVISELF